MNFMEGICSFCGIKIEYEERIGRQDTCPSCKRDLHSCMQCEFYDERAYNKCREPQAERVVDKEKANFCDYFRFSDKKTGIDKKRETMSKLGDLFKK